MGRSVVLVVAEIRGGLASPLTRELLGLARELAAGSGADVAALLIAQHDTAAQDLIAHGADRVCFCEQPDADEYDGELWVPIAERVAREIAPMAVLAGHTPAGADLAPRLAARLESGAAMGCVAVALESGRLLFTRPCYGGNVRETLSFTAAPAIATVKAGVGSATLDAARHGEIVRVAAPVIKPRARIVARERESADSKSLEDAKIIVAGGRGLEGPEGFRVLEALADVLGGAVGASRVPCDLGWCPHSWQIGLTGKTVTPDLYFAVGISGAGHHMAGCGNARTIVAINTDPQAAIFRDARFGVVGDYRRILPALIEALKSRDATT
jgi:electron transfer flavoprotein alpha subunit